MSHCKNNNEHHNEHSIHAHLKHCHEMEQSHEDCCPVEMKAKLLKSAFFDAMYQAHVSAFQKKIETQFADKIDKATDIALEVMRTKMKAKLTADKAKHEAMQKLKEEMFSYI